MIAVIFELYPAGGRRDDYLDRAAALRPLLNDIDGFISVERFQSLTDPDKYVSLSFFEDEAAVTRWRKTGAHRHAQSAAQDGIFRDYRLRIAEVRRDYGLHDRHGAPEDSQRMHDEWQGGGET